MEIPIGDLSTHPSGIVSSPGQSLPRREIQNDATRHIVLECHVERNIMKRRLHTSLIMAALGAFAILPGGLASPMSASAQVYGQTDGGNVYRPGTSVYYRLGRSAYGVPRDPDYAPYNYNRGLGQGAYLPGYGR